MIEFFTRQLLGRDDGLQVMVTLHGEADDAFQGRLIAVDAVGAVIRNERWTTFYPWTSLVSLSMQS